MALMCVTFLKLIQVKKNSRTEKRLINWRFAQLPFQSESQKVFYTYSPEINVSPFFQCTNIKIKANLIFRMKILIKVFGKINLHKLRKMIIYSSKMVLTHNNLNYLRTDMSITCSPCNFYYLASPHTHNIVRMASILQSHPDIPSPPSLQGLEHQPLLLQHSMNLSPLNENKNLKKKKEKKNLCFVFTDICQVSRIMPGT